MNGINLPIEKAEKIKFFVIKTENELAQGFKTPILPIESVVPFLYPNLKSAILSLQTELTYFEEYFKTNPNVKTINPTMGELNYEEWKIFHNKHFHHHFKQFDLV